MLEASSEAMCSSRFEYEMPRGSRQRILPSSKLVSVLAPLEGSYTPHPSPKHREEGGCSLYLSLVVRRPQPSAFVPYKSMKLVCFTDTCKGPST